MKKLIAIIISTVLVLCVAGCKNNPGGNGGGEKAAKRTEPLKYGINAHLYEQRPMDPSATLDRCSDIIGIMGFEYYRLSTPLDAMFTVAENDTLVFKENFKNLVHEIIKKMSDNGVKKFVAVSDSPIYPFNYTVTASGVVPDPEFEKDDYDRFVRLYAKAWGMIAEEFPEITHIEPMNEPDLPGTDMFSKQGHMWGMDDGYSYRISDKAHMIADLQYYIYKEVKAANPKAIVTTPGFAAFGEGQEILDLLYEAIESGDHPFLEDTVDTDPDHYFDAINFHKYLGGDTTDHYYEYCDNFYKACERHNDSGKPALITEWGFSDNDSEAQEIVNGENMTKQLEMFNEKMPYLEAVLVYDLNDLHGYSVNLGEDNYGLFSSAGDPEKPSCPKPDAIALYKYMHNTEDVSPLYKYCPDLKP